MCATTATTVFPAGTYKCKLPEHYDRSDSRAQKDLSERLTPVGWANSVPSAVRALCRSGADPLALRLATHIEATLDPSHIEATLDPSHIEATLDPSHIEATLDPSHIEATLDP